MEIHNIRDLLEYCIEFSVTELQSFQTEKDLVSTENQVVSSLFRSIIEYILNDPQRTVDRARAYEVGYHLQQIDFATDAIEAADEIETDVQRMNEAIRQHTKIINQAEFGATLAKFERMKERYYPKWYSLFGGLRSLRQLVLDIREDEGVLYSIFSGLSKSAHNYITL